MEYNITFSEPDTDNVIHSTTVSTCGEDTCETDITLPSSTLVCPPSTFTVDVSADHGYGQTLLSDPINTGIYVLTILTLYIFTACMHARDIYH